jgi:hypothetical protein
VTNGSANSAASGIAIAHIGLTTAISSEFAVPPSSGYTGVVLTTPGSQGFATSGGYKILSATETTSASWSWTTATWCAGVVATFKPLVLPSGPVTFGRTVQFFVTDTVVQA